MKNMRKIVSLFFALLCISVVAFAQPRTITGKVTDANGNPISNASVTIKGTSKGTITRADGTYSISVLPNAKIIVFSATGSDAIEYAIGNKGIINTSLQSSEKTLSEVVVVGYGTQKKQAFTGSASKVDTKEFSNLLSPSIDKQLAGRATGVQVTNSGGSVNTPAAIRIRGTQSITGNNEPLIVVDGIPIISGNLSATTNSNALGDINPADIESMDILKDGSATAIYGSRGANGVILITTKKGTKGRSRVSYDGFIGFSSALKKFDLLNAKEFETIANEKLTNAGLPIRAGVNASADTSNTDWQSQVLIKNSVAQSHTISVAGGNEKTTYYFSASYSDQKGIVISNYNKAYRIRMNIDHEINKFVKIGNNLSISRQEDGDQNNSPNGLGGAVASTLRMLPNVSPFSSQNITGYNIGYPLNNLMSVGPNTSTIDDNFSNVAYTIRNDKYYSDKYRIIENAFLEVSPVKGLKLRSQVGADMLNDYSYQGLNPFHGDGYGKGENFNVESNWLRLLWSNYFNYNFSLGNHNFFLTGGNEFQKETYKWFSADGTSLSDPFYAGNNVITNAQTTQVIGGNYDIKNGFISYFGRFNYDYKNKYFAQASVRRDGQSALAPGHKYGTFPGFSAGWRPSQESFWQHSPFLSKWLPETKIKGSYSKVGNTVGTPNPNNSTYPYLSNFVNAPYGNISGIAPSTVGNPSLQWETSAKYDLGIELGILKNRFSFTADWFLNDNNNLILAVPQPLSAGLVGSLDLNGGTISQNVGTLRNKGIELALSGNIIKSHDFSWNFNLNYSKVENKITTLYSVGGVPVANIANGAYNITRVGDPINIIFGYQNAGVNSANGNPMWYKADGSLVQLNLTSSLGTVGNYYAATKGTAALGASAPALNTADKVKLGQGLPTWFGAFSNSFHYKSFGLDIMLRYSGGNQIMNFTRQEALFNMSFQNNGKEILNRWTTAGQETDVPKLYYGQAANINSTGNATSRFVESGNYLRLQNIVLSYSIDSKKMEQVTNGYVHSLRFFVQGQNLYVWTKYKGADPDNIGTSTLTTALGVDGAASPQVRTFSFGLSAGF